ncbi:MAG TPA: hypothetical protein VMG12_15810 [Polyangiaceae bacterium]|nr:hypothetical protein [Polyangiaceae bacterium]
MTRRGGLVVGVLLSLARTGAAAEVDWRGPEHCPDSDDVRFRIERAIGMPLSHAAPLRFDVRAQHAARGFVASIDVHPSSGAATRQRELAAAECGQLADMVTVAVALALGADVDFEPDGVADAHPKAASSNEPAESTTVASDAGASVGAMSPAVTGRAHEAAADGARDGGIVDAVATSAAAGSALRWQPGVSLGFVGDAGSLPNPGVGASAGVSLGRGRFGLRAGGTWFFEQHASVDTIAAAPAGADLALLVGALSGCLLPFGNVDSSVVALGCAGWELGRMSGKGTGVQQPRQGAALWNAPRLDAGASVALGSTGLRLDALLTLAVPLGRENFTLDEVGSVHRPAAVVGRASLALAWIPK